MPSFRSLIQADAGLQIPTGAAVGEVLVSDASGNASWADRRLRLGNTWAILGALTAAMAVPEFHIPVATGQVVNVVGVRAKIQSGTSIVAQLQKNAVNVGSAVTVTTTAATTAIATTIADGDALDLVLSAPTGSPVDLSYTVILEHTFSP